MKYKIVLNVDVSCVGCACDSCETPCSEPDNFYCFEENRGIDNKCKVQCKRCSEPESKKAKFYCFQFENYTIPIACRNQCDSCANPETSDPKPEFYCKHAEFFDHQDSCSEQCDWCKVSNKNFHPIPIRDEVPDPYIPNVGELLLDGKFMSKTLSTPIETRIYGYEDRIFRMTWDGSKPSKIEDVTDEMKGESKPK